MKNKAILVYFLVIALDSISFGLIASILAPLLARSSVFFVGYSSFLQYCLYGVLISVFSVFFMIGAPVLGVLSDRFGRKCILLWCLMLMLIAFVGYGVAFVWESVWILLLARALAGLSAGSQGVAQAAVVDFAKQHERPLAISTIAIGMTAGLIIGPLVASVWSHTASWVPFLIIIILSLLSVFLLVRYVSNTYSDSPKKSWKIFFQQPNIKKLLGMFLLFELGWSLYYQALPLWLSVHWDMQHQELGWISSFVGSLLALCLFLGMRIGLRLYSLSKLIYSGFCLGVLGLVFMMTDVQLPVFFMLVLPIVLAVALIYPGLISRLSEMTSSEHQGLLMGISDGILAFAFAVTGMLSSVLIYFNVVLPFCVAAVCWIAAGIWFFKYNRRVLCNSVSM